MSGKTLVEVNGWRVKEMSGYRISHPFIAVAPGCPDDRHPTRDCGCAVFKTMEAAMDHVMGQVLSPVKQAMREASP